jgi:hypothetical protein
MFLWYSENINFFKYFYMQGMKGIKVLYAIYLSRTITAQFKPSTYFKSA